MLQFLLLLSAAVMQANSISVRNPEERLQMPAGIPDLNVDAAPLFNLDKLKQSVTGWGLFNLGTDVQKMVFTLHTNKENKDEVLIPENPSTFLNSAWDKTQKTIIVIHGFAEDATGGLLSPTKKVADAYAKANRPENIVFVDWRYLARQLDYFTSANNTIKAGLRVAEFLITLKNTKFISNLDQVHLVGFSLGAHVSAVAAYWTNAMFDGEKIARISGLDPAGPGFAKANLKNRLDSSDATFVDAMHTNMGNLITTFGTTFKSGHVDFYPNGGEHQPGCSIPMVGEIMGVCSHIKAPDYFANSILGTQYMGCPCADWSTFQKGGCNCTDGPLMGEFVDQSTTGDYYLAIPYGQ